MTVRIYVLGGVVKCDHHVVLLLVSRLMLLMIGQHINILLAIGQHINMLLMIGQHIDI